MCGRRLCGRFRIAGADGAVDRVVLLDRLGGVPAHRAAQADEARLRLQPARLPHGDLEEHVVRGGGDGGVEGVVALVEQVFAPGLEALAAQGGGFLDGPQLGRGGAAGGQSAGLHLLRLAELEQHVDVVEVGRKEEGPPAPGAEHPLVVGHVQPAALLGAHPAQRGEDLHRLAHHGAAGAQPPGQLVLGRHAVARTQAELDDQFQHLLGRHLVARPVSALAGSVGHRAPSSPFPA